MPRRELRLLGDKILVRMDPEDNTVAGGLLYKPDDAYETIMRTGEVVSVGPGRWASDGDVPLNKRCPVGVEVGDGVVFNRFIATHTKTAQTLHQYLLKDEEALIGPKDVLLVYDRKNPVKFA